MTTKHLDHPPAAPDSGWAVVKQTWSDPDRWIGVGVAAAPGLVFVAVDAAGGLGWASAAAGTTAAAGLALRLLRGSSVRSVLIGMVIVAACAGVALLTGEARGFFLLPAMIPFVVIGLCLVTIAVRRPLTGLILNRVSGGPPDWYDISGLRRVHTAATWTAVAVNVVNAVIQVVFFRRNDTAVLAFTHVAIGPIFATLVAVTIVAARRAQAVQR
jgi:Protein of unknown function (DUF3159)